MGQLGLGGHNLRSMRFVVSAGSFVVLLSCDDYRQGKGNEKDKDNFFHGLNN